MTSTWPSCCVTLRDAMAGRCFQMSPGGVAAMAVPLAFAALPTRAAVLVAMAVVLVAMAVLQALTVVAGVGCCANSLAALLALLAVLLLLALAALLLLALATAPR